MPLPQFLNDDLITAVKPTLGQKANVSAAKPLQHYLRAAAGAAQAAYLDLRMDKRHHLVSLLSIERSMPSLHDFKR